jgi:hypothetical protein
MVRDAVSCNEGEWNFVFFVFKTTCKMKTQTKPQAAKQAKLTSIAKGFKAMSQWQPEPVILNIGGHKRNLEA